MAAPSHPQGTDRKPSPGPSTPKERTLSERGRFYFLKTLKNKPMSAYVPSPPFSKLSGRGYSGHPQSSSALHSRLQKTGELPIQFCHTQAPKEPLCPPPPSSPLPTSPQLIAKRKEREQPRLSSPPSPKLRSLPPLHKGPDPKAKPQQTRRQPFQPQPGRESTLRSAQKAPEPQPLAGVGAERLSCQKCAEPIGPDCAHWQLRVFERPGQEL